MSDDLKPCPFCGGVNLESGGDDKFVGVWCLDCGCVGPNHYDSRRDWNTRADRIEELEAERDDYASKLMEANNTYTEMHNRIEKLEAELKQSSDDYNKLAAKEYYTEIRAEQAEAKLAKAVELGLEECPFWDGSGAYNDWWHDRRTTLKELTGDSDE